MSCVTQSNQTEFASTLPGIPLQIVPYPNIQSLLFMCVASFVPEPGYKFPCIYAPMINGPNDIRATLHSTVGPLLWFCHTLRVICTYPPNFHCNFCIRHPHPASRSLPSPSAHHHPMKGKGNCFLLSNSPYGWKFMTVTTYWGAEEQVEAIRMRWIRAGYTRKWMPRWTMDVVCQKGRCWRCLCAL